MDSDQQWKKFYLSCAVMAFLGLLGIVTDVILGIATGGDLTALPHTAIERFSQLQENTLLGLYNLDLLNSINQIILIPAYFAILVAHRNTNLPFAALAFVVFLAGSILFIAGNTALPMLELSTKFAAESDQTVKAMYAAAGEGLLAKGEHGSLGVFIGFILPNIAGLLFSLVMLSGKIFNRLTSWLGITGSSLLIVYLILVTFTDGGKMATLLAMPGGLLSMAWISLFAIRLIQLGRQKTNPET